MPQNVYDSLEFFNQYSQLQRSREGLQGAPEWPTLRGLVGDVGDADVLDIGCGYGWFSRWASGAGARSVHGMDVSLRMLEQARSYPDDARIRYELVDVETLVLPEAVYNVVYSSLALHYLPDLKPVFQAVANGLKRGGCFVFSVEHPTMTAPSDATWHQDHTGKQYWPLNDYAKEGLRVSNWLGAGEVHKYHHRIETYLMGLLEAGLSIEAVRESWDNADLSCEPGTAESGHRPYFLLVKTRKS